MSQKISGSTRLVKWAKAHAFGSVPESIATVVFLFLSAIIFIQFIDWAIISAVWTAESVDQCSEANGACWSVIDARHRLILFGLYPYEEHWRSTLACLAIVLTIVLSCIPYFWTTTRLSILWVAGFSLYLLFMDGALLGLAKVTTDQWGGLALTLFLFASVVLIGMPMGLAFALLRRSKLPVISGGISLVIDLIRSLPLLTTLFTAAVVVPIILPEWFQGDKLTRVIIAFSLFFACYQAEVLRGAFQAIRKGQYEAGSALGLTNWQVMRRIILPQVFRHAMPGTINMIVVTFKETAIVIIIGFFDILASANASFGTAEWAPYYIEVYVFVGFIYWAFIFSLGQYGSYLGRKMQVAAH